MLNKFKTFFIDNKEITVLVFFGILYRLLLHYFLYDNIIIENDSGSYLNLAKKIENYNLIGYNGERTLGYPILLFLGFNSFKVVVFYQHILGIITSVFFYKTILNFNFSKRNGLWIVLFIQSFLNIFFYEASILVESLSLFLISIVFYFLTNNYIERQHFKLDFLMSFVFGYLTLTKPFFVFIPFIIYGFIVLNKFKIIRIINKRIIILFFPLVAYFGSSYLNKINTGSFTSTTYLGFNLSQNCVYFAEKGPKKYKWISEPYAKRRDLILKKDKNSSAAMAIWDTYCGGDYDYKKLSFAKLSQVMASYSIETIKSNPKDYFKQVVTKSWLNFWRPTIPINNYQFLSSKKKFYFTSLWFVQRKFYNIFKYGFIVLVPLYFYTFFKNKVITNQLILVTIVFATSVLQGLVTYGTNARYSFPFEYLMILIGLVFIKNNIKLPTFFNNFLK